MKVLALAAALAVPAMAISPISVKGSKLFTSDGKQFFMKGIAYQLTNDDPLANGPQCALDAKLMQSIGVNSIRVYHVDASASHDDCMKTFADAGIYPWIDLDTFSTYILQPTSTTPTWTQSQYNAFAAVMDAFAKYDNVAGFFVANELLNAPADSVGAPYIKAAARDMKAYRDNKGYRKFPIGYTAADIASLRPMLQNYMACGSDSSAALDVYGLNAYEWCGNVDFQTSGYAALQQNASQYNIPIFFSETGCIKPAPRMFGDQAAILGPDMDGTWSGAIIYEWIQEANEYGIVSYGPPAATGSNVVDGFTRAGTPTPIQPDFSNLSKQWATLNPTGVMANDYTPSLSAPPCPAYTSGVWLVDPSAPLPTLGQAYTGAASAQSYGSGASSPTGSATTTTTGGSAAAVSGTTTASTTTKSGAAQTMGAELAAAAALAFMPFIAIF
ncbi:hypothetical protein AMS68_003318 [Peltaster fructicola]|uniref:1,3-beta-glucanosyltransferase n=1 Tax=Peltaster fructicola TaxID=286661 RepID=A0A6H0XT09_9PEZI|nr:hypothetical protein AMS68_003318 [Peltaster fructicola]